LKSKNTHFSTLFEQETRTKSEQITKNLDFIDIFVYFSLDFVEFLVYYTRISCKGHYEKTI